MFRLKIQILGVAEVFAGIGEFTVPMFPVPR
jgi:hypothetical protein